MTWTEACSLTALDRKVWIIAFGEVQGKIFDWDKLTFVEPKQSKANPKFTV